MSHLQKTITWKKSRSGAWAGRGFHYQHLISTLIALRQWAGFAPTGFIVPEGLEDCVVELASHDIWLQIKSRKEGVFKDTKVQQILAGVNRKTETVKGKKSARIAVVLEQPCHDANEVGIDQLFENVSHKVFICRAPDDEIIKLISTHLDTAEIIAEGIASDLFKLISEASQENASLPFEKRRRISTTEVERRIFERLEAEDPSAIDKALTSGGLEPVDFITPVNEPSFYQGVKVRPGHVAAGLVLDRPDELNDVVSALKRQRQVLISGPSGAGKSALMWLSANALAGEFRWYQITGKASVDDAGAIQKFVRARRPSDISPIALAFDEVASSNSGLWDILVRELRGLPSVYFLGSVRQEDIHLIVNQSDTAFIAVNMNEELARTVWEKLSEKKETKWKHWREPFEQSEGLMLEYVHLLTMGRRLAAVIEEQIRLREHEERQDELSIIRSTAVLCTHGGEVSAVKLFKLLGMKPEAASQALKRLIDEHLVRESRPGVLGGMHMLRSQVLSKASHDEIVFLTEDSFWLCLPAATSGTLPAIIQSVLAGMEDETETAALGKLAKILADNHDLGVWMAILTGLGLATLECRVSLFMTILEDHGVQRAHWSVASFFIDPDTSIPDFSELEQWQSLRKAVLNFRASPVNDLRSACLKMLPADAKIPVYHDLKEANLLFSCLVPICGSDPVKIAFHPEFEVDDEQDIQQVSAMLSTAYLIDPDMATNIVAALGGEQILFAWFRSQTPWVTAPVIEPDGEHGRTVRSNLFHVAEQYQHDPRDTVVNICETLIALSPDSDAAASDAVDPLGQPMSIGDYAPWSKNMPRENIPAKARIVWNVAFRQIFLARSAAYSLTEYTQQMAQLVRRTEKIFRSFSERWIKGKSNPNAEAMADKINQVLEEVNALAYAAPKKPAHEMSSPAGGTGDDDTLGALLTGVFSNLMPRIVKNSGEDVSIGEATFAGDLAGQSRQHEQSDIWRMTSSPPLDELAALRKRLEDVSSILHEMAYDGCPTAIQGIIKAAKTGSMGKAVSAAARRCRSLADKRFHSRLRELESALEKQGWSAKCWSRPIDESDSIFWPAMEVAVLVEIDDFENDLSFIEDGLAAGQRILENDWRFRIVPVLEDKVMASMTFLPSSHIILPDSDFEKEWQEHIDRPFLSATIVKKFDEAMTACTQVSAILVGRGLENMHLDEEEAFTKVIGNFERNFELVVEVAEETGSEFYANAVVFLNENWQRVVREFEAIKAGQAVDEPLCMNAYLALNGEESEWNNELAAARTLLLQAGCENEVGGK